MRLLDVPLIGALELQTADDRQPLVEATIEGAETLLVVDTGATETLITEAFAERLGLPIAPAEAGRDHGGWPVATWTTQAPVSLTIGDFRTGLHNATVVRAPARFERSGVGGVLCPQRLHATAWLWLDFPAGHMLLIEHDPGHDQHDLERELWVTELELIPLSGDEASLVVASGGFDDSAIQAIMFNTGSWDAELSPLVAPVVAEAEAARGFGLSGKAASAQSIGLGHLIFGDVVAPAAELLVRPQPQGLSGQIGMQLLQHTKLEINLLGRQLRWWTPKAWQRRD